MSKRKPTTAAPLRAAPEAILPLTDFRGDPWKIGDKNAVAFRAGVMSSPVPADFAEQARNDGKAAKKTAPTGGDQSPKD